MYTVAILAFFLLFCVLVLNYLQEKHEAALPPFLKTWKFLPKSLRTLRTVDFVVQTYMEVYCCCLVKRTVALVPVIGGFSSSDDTGFDLNNGNKMQMVKIERNKDKSEN